MPTKLTYKEQLLDPRWQRKRLEILQRDEFTCKICFDSESTLHVHHKHYHKGRMPWEYEAHELVTLCESCHEGIGWQDDSRKDIYSKLNVDGPYSVGDALALAAGWANQNCGHDLEEHRILSPYSFTLGEVIDALDVFEWNMPALAALRDALMAAPAKTRLAGIDMLIAFLREE